MHLKYEHHFVYVAINFLSNELDVLKSGYI